MEIHEVQKQLFRVMGVASQLHAELHHNGEAVSLGGCKICDLITDSCRYLEGFENAQIRQAKDAAAAIVGRIVS